MDKQSELVELLRKVIKEQPEIAQGGIHIHIHGHVVLGTDVGAVTAFKLLLRAHNSSQEDPPVLKAKLVP